MELSYILGLLGGLSLFLYGMHMMSEGLEQSAGDRLQSILEKLTRNRILAIIVGAVITAVIQSSSATTVMVIGFVSSGLMPLRKAVWVIMGANIGTTITGQLIALDIGMIAPLFAITGTVMVTFMKNKKINHIGEVIAGLGILFIGMNFMGDAMAPLQSNEGFINLMTTFSNPLYGIIAGAIFTAIIQSSSASIGILQTLASQGLISLQSSSFVLFGQNIGTCITASLASLSGNRNAKRAALIHLLFNVIGTVIFVSVCLYSPFIEMVGSWTPGNPMAQIANVHTIFNIVTTLVLLPFGNYLADLSIKLLPMKDEEVKSADAFVTEIPIGASILAVNQMKVYLHKMFTHAEESFKSIGSTYLEGAKSNRDLIKHNEDYINALNYQISEFMKKISRLDLQDSDQQQCNIMFKLSLDIERISDHIMNLLDYGIMLNQKEIIFPESIKAEIKRIQDNIENCFDALSNQEFYQSETSLIYISDLEQKMDDMCRDFRENQINRLTKEISDSRTTVIYSDLLTNMERISDHMKNLAEALYATNVDLRTESA